MEFKTRLWFVLNRGGERIIADENGLVITENKEAIEVLKNMFPILEAKKEEWKSVKKK